MSEKHRGEVNFAFKKGCFHEYTSFEPIQLYQLYEKEIHTARPLDAAVFPEGYLLLYCVFGSGALTFGDERIAFNEGTLIFCAADLNAILEVTDSKKELRYICLNIGISNKAVYTPTTQLCNYFCTVTTPVAAESVTELGIVFSRMIAELSLSVRPLYQIVRGLLYRVLIYAYRAFTRTASPDNSSESAVHAVGHTVYAIIRYVDEHLYSMHNLTDMAAELGYSYNYLSHLFRRKTGMTIQAYVSRKKIEKSVELLSEHHLSITEVATLLNYDCIQSFSKAFKRAMNMSPTEYRAMRGIRDE